MVEIETAPFDRDTEVAVVENDGKICPVIFPCCRVLSGWTKAAGGGPRTIHPTHWQAWEKSKRLSRRPLFRKEKRPQCRGGSLGPLGRCAVGDGTVR